MAEYQLLIGACGWDHADWQDQFYPDDLPEDWRLGYYSNEYRVVLIPADYWRRADFSIETLLDNSEAGLRFVIEMLSGDAEDSDALSRQLDSFDAFGDRCAGIVYRLDENDATAVAVLQARLQQCAAHFSTCVQFTHDADATLVDWCRQHGLGVVWNGQGEPLTPSTLNVARIADTVLSAKELRSIIETCLGWGESGKTTVLLFDGQPPSLEQMDNAGVILELL